MCSMSQSAPSIENLQTLHNPPHRHIIQLMGSFSRQGYKGEGNLILSPLAECTPEEYLSKEPVTGRKETVRQWFGCLAGGLMKMHKQRIKHKDIKPGNLLVHGDNVIITDMGISNKFFVRSTSYGDSRGTWTVDLYGPGSPPPR